MLNLFNKKDSLQIVMPGGSGQFLAAHFHARGHVVTVLARSLYSAHGVCWPGMEQLWAMGRSAGWALMWSSIWRDACELPLHSGEPAYTWRSSADDRELCARKKIILADASNEQGRPPPLAIPETKM